MSIVSQLATILLNGLQQGAIYVLVAIGLSIILGTLKFVNFAHGALYLIGTYLGLLITLNITISDGKLAEWGYGQVGLDLGFLPALVIVPIIVFGVGLLMERFIARPFYDRPDTDQILLTFGLAIVVQEAFKILFGGQSYNFARPAQTSLGSIELQLSGPIDLPLVGTIGIWRLYVIAITAVLVALVYLLIEYTDFGLVVRAGTRDAEMVRLLGVKITRPYLMVFGVGAALAGIAGVVGGTLYAVNPNIGMEVLVPSFLVVVIGGVGSIRGAVVGGILIGLTLSSLVAVAPQWSQVGIYVLAAIILLARPQGLLGSEEVAP
ncbi:MULTISPECIES: branched-chain amino acid ABC transporter permease [Haladaptatus]|uniref:Amino acid/amide ABC transporter membrane protein 1, HAAT family n=1 Tax=Haladaptatus paucihalophilus DX253 TaxID=797209 RepID=A0A1M6QDY1_HALPU|nr:MULTISPECIES: branched-chain amino acid ABC transporter permease [Haladaptatus]GKZ13812.1 branched-chain amino acid ABC transporter permease [Haladaptatus sp. T7]SHK18388.1 amino acid/amide ABC transporter membrane protein 1, HAAT family [Haladaptatus paucihalophilus DX253]